MKSAYYHQAIVYMAKQRYLPIETINLICDLWSVSATTVLADIAQVQREDKENV